MLSAAVGLYLLASSAHHFGADSAFGDSIRDQVARRLAHVDHRARLFRNIAWWYVLPLALTTFLMIYGSGGDVTEEPWIVPTIDLFLIAVYIGNRWWGPYRYEPEVTRPQALLADFG